MFFFNFQTKIPKKKLDQSTAVYIRTKRLIQALKNTSLNSFWYIWLFIILYSNTHIFSLIKLSYVVDIYFFVKLKYICLC